MNFNFLKELQKKQVKMKHQLKEVSQLVNELIEEINKRK